MKNKRLRNYLQQKANRDKELNTREDIQSNPDKHMDQDFSGFPHAPAKEEIINPRSKEDKKTAAINVKDGEKVIDTPAKQKSNKQGTDEDEIQSEGSANAFEGTESVRDDE